MYLQITALLKNLEYPQGEWERVPRDTGLPDSAVGAAEAIVNDIMKVTGPI